MLNRVLNLTKKSEYGLLALVHLAEREGSFVSAREISEQRHAPHRLLAEVLKHLCRDGIVDSLRGAAGGYALARPATSIRMGEVIASLEGAPPLTEAGSLDAYDAHHPICSGSNPIVRLRQDIWNLMQRTTLADLARPRSNPALEAFSLSAAGPSSR